MSPVLQQSTCDHTSLVDWYVCMRVYTRVRALVPFKMGQHQPALAVICMSFFKLIIRHSLRLYIEPLWQKSYIYILNLMYMVPFAMIYCIYSCRWRFQLSAESHHGSREIILYWTWLNLIWAIYTISAMTSLQWMRRRIEWICQTSGNVYQVRHMSLCS